MAERLSGIREAGRLLLDLCERHYFTDRREHAEAAFQYHALFREFLLDRVRQRYSSAERHRLEQRAARLLEAQGHDEDAVALYCRSGDVEAAIRLILEQAPKLLAQGRTQALAGWISELPEQHVRAQPWLGYWLAMARMSSDPAAGRELLEHAYLRFGELQDARGQLFAACGVVEALYVEWTDFTQLDRWLEPLDRLLPRAAAEPAEIELRALCALLTLALYRRPQHPGLPACIERIEQLLHREGVDPAQKVKAGTRLLNYYFWQGDPEPGLRLMKLMMPLTAHAVPLEQVWAWVAYGYGMSLRAEGKQAADAIAQALSIAEQNGLGFLRGALSMHVVYAILSDGDPEAAEPHLNAAAPLLDESRHLEFSLYQWDRAWQAALRDDHHGAVHHGEKALEHALATGIWGPITISLIGLAESLVELQQHDRALACLQQARSRSAEVRSPSIEFHILLIEASSTLLQGDAVKGREDVARALAFGLKHEFVVGTRWLPKPMARLLAFALDHGIEPEYARSIIRKRKLVPESPDVENWPWPVSVHTLGRFTVLVDGHGAVAATAPGRPLELLKALIAAGGRQVHAEALIARLWPDADDGRKTLDINLHRLRKLLGSDAACLLHDARLTLDPACCWVDVWAFERACNRIAEPADPTPEPAAAAERLLHLYQGPFLANDAEQPWTLAPRERLRSKFLRCVQTLGQQLEGTGRWDEATALYQRGLEADSLADELYRRLMLCHHARGRRAEALEVYRRCRHMLAVVLGIEPSAATQAAYRSLLEGG